MVLRRAPPPPLDSPLPTPTATPIPSQDAQIALDYLVTQQQLPKEELQIVSEETVAFTQLGRTYTLVTIIHDQPDRFQSFTLLVDQKTKAVAEDLNALRAAEADAVRAKYGKLEPTLYDYLQTIGDDELVPIAVWAIQGVGERSPDEIAAELATRYPEGAKALAEQGIVWAVDDPKLRTQIEQEYNQALTAATTERVAPIVAWLREKGYTVEELSGAPSVAATIRKVHIMELANLELVSQIFLMGVKAEPDSDIAVPSNRVPTVWGKGITGGNVRVAIVETDNINPTASSCMNIIARRDYALASSGHKSIVASIAACNDSTLRGVAYGAQILDAGHGGSDSNAAAALLWAVNSNTADVTNQSEAFQTDTALQYLDKFYDYAIRTYLFTAVKSAGNTSGNVTTPGKGWNIITVGNLEDKGNANWSDDTMRSTSSYINPNTGAEKPEVAAPGTDINTVVGQDTGTSHAAPQVAGVAALLMHRQSTLKDWPSVVKAIIMASAVHNVDGASQLSDKDGAGGIDAALADQTAQIQGGTGTCTAPCWWNINTNTTTPALNTSLERTFNASRGEKVRVVISWLSQADSNGTTDSLLTNYDLYVRRADNNAVVASSTSASNNFEIVEFTAPASVQYKLQVFRNSSGDNNEASNKLGIAWVKDATYLPDLRNNNGGWTSSIYVRNNGPLLRSARITFFNTGGGYNTEATTNLQPNALWLPVPPANWQGNAIVDGGEDLAVAVRNDGTGISTLDTGFVAGGSGDPAFEVAATTLYGPVAYNNIFGGLNSTIYVQNTSKDSNSVTVYFYGRTGYGDYISGWVVPLNANGSGALSTSTVMGSTPWVGSVQIVAGQLVVAKIYESQGSTTSRTYGATAGGKSLMYVPAAYKNQFSFNTGLVIQNLGGSATNVTVTYCDRDNTVCSAEPVFSLNAQRATGINVGTTGVLPASWTGSIKIESTGGVPLGIAVTNANSSGGYDINGTNFGSKVVTLPWAARDAGGRTTGYTLRNVSGQNGVTVIAKYYDIAGGNPVWTRPINPVNSAQVKGFFQNTDTLPVGWQGSIVLESTANIVAIMREDTSTTLGGYNGVPR